MEQLRSLYGVLGPGFPAEAVRIFGGDATDCGDWCVRHRGRTLHCLRASEFSDEALP